MVQVHVRLVYTVKLLVQNLLLSVGQNIQTTDEIVQSPSICLKGTNVSSSTRNACSNVVGFIVFNVLKLKFVKLTWQATNP